MDFCHAQAFGFEEKEGKKRTVVKNLNACVVMCRGCEDICPAGAITHPSEKETKERIKKLQEAALTREAIILKKVLFVCVENAGRSQMAEAFAKKYGEDKFVVSSAGNKPAEKVNPVVVEVMKEKGIDYLN